MGNLISALSSIFQNYDETITVYNFIQGKVGNCGMISSMSTLANDKNLFNKVVPIGQNFYSKNSSKVMFNLYKLGKIYEVEVDKTLPTKYYSFIYCRSSNNNIIGPLLEKALVKLHFEGSYESSKAVPASFVMSSLTNNFFEEFYFLENKKSHFINKLINYGSKEKCKMIVLFNGEEAKKFNLKARHYYSLLDVEKNKNNSVKLYNPHGKIVSIQKMDFVKALKKLEMSYFDNKIFEMPKINKKIDFIDKWPTLNSNEKMNFVDYKLIVSEDEIEILINVILKKSNKDLKATIFIISNYEKNVIKSSLSVVNKKSKRYFFHKTSLRAKLKQGQYRIVAVMSRFNKFESCEESRKYFENGGNEFLFRLAASKQCIVAKSLKKENDEKKNVY